MDVRLDEVVLRALEQEPERRYQQASEVKTDVEAISREPERSAAAAASAGSGSGGLVPRQANLAPGVDEGILAQLYLPGLAVMFAGLFGLVLSIAAVAHGLAYAWNGRLTPGVPLAVIGLVGLPFSWVCSLAGANLKACQRYEFASQGSFLAAIPLHLGWWLGLPAGIWAIRVLNRPDVKAAFQGRRGPTQLLSAWPGWWLVIGLCMVGGLLQFFFFVWMDRSIAARTPQSPLEVSEPLSVSERERLLTDDERILGTWIEGSGIGFDEEVRNSPEEPWKVTYLPNGEFTVHYQVGDMETVDKGTYRIDATKSPKEIDLVNTTGVDKGLHLIGIYELDGDRLRTCWAYGGGSVSFGGVRAEVERPKEFSAPPGSGLALYIQKRERPADDAARILGTWIEESAIDDGQVKDSDEPKWKVTYLANGELRKFD